MRGFRGADCSCGFFSQGSGRLESFLIFLLGVFAEGSMSWALLFRSSLMKMLVEREVTEVLVAG